MTQAAPTRRPRDREELLKQELRTGASLYDLSAARIADMCDETDDLVEQWLSPTSRVNVPLRILTAPRLHRGLRTYLLEGLDRQAGEAPTHGADTPETQTMVALRLVGQFVTATAATMADAHIGRESAAQLLVIVERNLTSLSALASRLRQRVSNGRASS